MSRKWVRVEKLLVVLGVGLLSAYGWARLQNGVESRLAHRSFHQPTALSWCSQAGSYGFTLSREDGPRCRDLDLGMTWEPFLFR